MASGDITGAAGLEAAFARLRKVAPECATRALKKCGILAHTEAVANAPRSPTMKILSKRLKGVKRNGVKQRRTKRRTFPGGLEKSITHELTPDGLGVSVFVPLNSPAAKYAKYIHDEKFVKWRNRGPGTEAKGQRADEKFVERAVRDNEAKFRTIFESEIMKGLGGI